MFGGSKQQAPPPPAPPPPPPSPPTMASSSVGRAGSNQASRSRGAGTLIGTSGQGDLLPANTAKKTLLGQ